MFSWLDYAAAAHKAFQNAFEQKPPREPWTATGMNFSGVIMRAVFEMTFRSWFYRQLTQLQWVHASCRLCSGFSMQSTFSHIIHTRFIVAVPHRQNENRSWAAAGFPHTYCLLYGKSVLVTSFSWCWQEGWAVQQQQEFSGLWAVTDCKNQAKSKLLLAPGVKAGTKLHWGMHVFSHPVLSPVHSYQWASVSYFKSDPWTHSSYPIGLLLYALLSLPEKRIYLYQELPYSPSLLCNCCLWSLTLPSKQSPHEEKYVHLLSDNSKHPLELNNKKN